MRASQVRRFCFIGGVALAALAGCSMPAADPPRAFPERGARVETAVFLSADGPAEPAAPFRFATVEGGETHLAIVSKMPRAVIGGLSCDGPVRVRAAGTTGPGYTLRPGTERPLRLPARGARAWPILELTSDTTRCALSWPEGHHLTLLRDGAPEASTPRAACPQVAHPAGDQLAQVFFAERPMDMTCAAPTGGVELVPGEIDALKWRLDRLTGGNVSLADLRAADPDMVLDFANAPRFDELILSYLHIRADLSGWLTLRAVAYHAAQGTRVRLLTAAGLTGPLDRGPLEALAAQYPNVELQYYPSDIHTQAGVLATATGSNHIKLFLGLSPEPGRSFALIGGRNLTDGFYLDGAASFPEHRFLRSYGPDARGLPWHKYFSIYDDFEMALTDRARVAGIARQFNRFSARDAAINAIAPTAAVSGQAVRAGSDGLVRHFISLPWNDAWAQEALFVDMFDAARDEIFIVSPFNYPTPKIEAALLRAAARGVDVRFVTRRGADEPPAMFTRALNQRFVRDRAGEFRFRLFQDGDRLLHAKIIVIDGRAAIVTSSNLNRRSFIHDTENGFVFLDRRVAGQLRDEALRYWNAGDPVGEPRGPSLPIVPFEVIPWLEQFF